ncbi:MAG: hypothetical protein NVSMB26_10650 [Beijerinckiaceae bacterium]
MVSEKPTILLTNAIHADAVEMLAPQARLVTAPDTAAATLRNLVRDADGIIVRAKLPDDIIDHAPKLRGIVRHGVGLDFIPVDAATARGIAVANLPGSNTTAVAEYVFAALLSLRRPLHAMNAQLRREGWGKSRALADGLSELGGTTLGILGVGTIGRRIAEMARHGFGMRVIGHSRKGTTLGGLTEAVDLDTLFAQSDAVVIACPLTDATRGIVSARVISLMRPHSLLINVARGPIVETSALIQALRAGAIGGAALDVHDIQPLPPDSPLFDCPNLLLTPHVAGITATSGRAMSLGAAEEMLRILRGERPLNLPIPPSRLPEVTMRITSIRAVPISFKVPEGQNVRLGIGRAVKRDAVLIKVETDEGLIGWGEAHHGRCPGAIAKLINTTLSELVLGMDALDVIGVWNRVYRMQLASHGMGAAAAMALSGLDLALWDIRGKACRWPLYRLLGGASRAIKAYAGGISLGYQEPSSLADEARAHVASGYRAVKLRVGDTPKRDIARVTAVREALGDDIEILVDANTSYCLDDVRRVMPAYEDLAVGWLEEPFPPHDHSLYVRAAGLGSVPLAAGENHFTRFEFTRSLEEGTLGFVQPDLSKTGGITETMRIAALASAWKVSVNPHTSATGINMVASIHVLAAVDNAGYFEGDVARHNPFRDDVVGTPYQLDSEGGVRPLEGAGLGIIVDEDFLAAHPLIEGPCYV